MKRTNVHDLQRCETFSVHMTNPSAIFPCWMTLWIQ